MFTNLTRSRDELVGNSAVRTSGSTDHLKSENCYSHWFPVIILFYPVCLFVSLSVRTFSQNVFKTQNWHLALALIEIGAY